MPATTREYSSTHVESIAEGPEAGQIVLSLVPSADPPVVGGHIALGPSPGLPRGMFAEVLAVRDAGQPNAAYVLGPAAVDEVYDDVSVRFDGPVTPVVVDENDEPVVDVATGRTDTITGDAASRDGPFACKEIGSGAADRTDALMSALPLPISIEWQRPRATHVFDATQPYLQVGLYLEPRVSIAFTAKTGITCELTDDWRRLNRLKLPLRNIGYVPVAAYLEPVYEFTISAAGSVEISQQHYVNFTLEKDGSEDLKATTTKSADPVEVSADAAISADMFAGGELSLLVGGGTQKTTTGVGLAGAIGPELSFGTSIADPGCLTLKGRIRGDLDARLAVWTKRWDVALASITSPWAELLRQCGLPDPEPVGGGTGAIASLAPGTSHTCAVLTGGSAKCWGKGTDGELGDGLAQSSPTPVAVQGDLTATGVSSGFRSSCAVRLGGSVACWGYGGNGELGAGTASTYSALPRQVDGVQDGVSLSSGPHAVCALRKSRAVTCWGSGLLGNGTRSSMSPPVAVSGITNAKEISVGTNFACALRTTATVACWGEGDYGELGGASPTTTPGDVPFLTDVTTIASRFHHTCAVRRDKSVWCWGMNSVGQLGDGTTTTRSSPVQVVGLTDAVDVAVGNDHSCALRVDGDAMCWGRGLAGQLGNETNGQSLTPVPVSNLVGGRSIAAGDNHTCVIGGGGVVSCWGYGLDGQLGNGAVANSNVPVTVG